MWIAVKVLSSIGAQRPSGLTTKFKLEFAGSVGSKSPLAFLGSQPAILVSGSQYFHHGGWSMKLAQNVFRVILSSEMILEWSKMAASY